MMVLSKYAKILVEEDMVLYSNSLNDKCLKVSKGVADIISLYLMIKYVNFIDNAGFDNEEDREFFRSIINKLIKYDIIHDSDIK